MYVCIDERQRRYTDKINIRFNIIIKKMPQLDVYIICNMLYGVISMFVFAYMLNTCNLLISTNLLLRIRKLKMYVDKRYLLLKLREIAFKLYYRLYIHICCREASILKILKKHNKIYDNLDIDMLKVRKPNKEGNKKKEKKEKNEKNDVL